ncbi:MAG: T9SS type A sorting domain-containing protein, partial [Bacteroidota bacterium]|nr:T9SS type A sorting domain-containing protein [Bacteroidota bacterium]
KYQMSWPSPGDDYYTEEGGTRRSFYGVNSVPTLYLDSNEGTHHSTGQLQTALDNALAIPADHEITASFQIDGTNLAVQADFSSFADEENVKAFIVVVENTTTGNVGNNGETEFTNVMMDMYPDGDGLSAALADGEHFYMGATLDMSVTHVEEMGDLSVVVFAQNSETGEIFQSAYATETTAPALAVSLVPFDGTTGISVDNPFVISFNQSMLLSGGGEITNSDISDFVTLTDVSKADVPFTGEINAEKSLIYIYPEAGYWTELTSHTLTLADNAVESVSGVTLSTAATTFTTSQYPAQTFSYTPSDGTVDVANDLTFLRIIFGQELRNPDGSEFTDVDVVTSFFIRDTESNYFETTGIIASSKKAIVLYPSIDLPYLTDIQFGVEAGMVANIYGVVLEETFITFTTEEDPAAAVVNLNENSFKIYPNPAKNSVNIELPAGYTEKEIQILDVTGKEVQVISNEEISPSFEVNVSNLKAGVYFCKFNINNSTITKRLVINK